MTAITDKSGLLDKLKPVGELKVVSIPFGSANDHYAFSIKPGNAVWGSSWSKYGWNPEFLDRFSHNMKTQDSRIPTISTQPARDEGNPNRTRGLRKEDVGSVRDRMSSNMSHVLIAIAILAAAMWVFKTH